MPDQNRWVRLDSAFGRFYPPTVRRFLTLKSMTVIVLLLVAWNVGLLLLVPHPSPPPPVLRRAIEQLRSPFFLIPFDLLLLPSFFLIVRAKPVPQFAYLRALAYGMVLAALLSQVFLIFPLWGK